MSNLARFPDNTGHKVKGFWKRPEGVTGMIVLAMVVIATVYVGGPFAIAAFGMLITLLGQVYAVAALAAGLAVIGFLATNRRIRTLVKLGFQGAMRKITGFFIEIDPIGIMRSYIEDLNKKQEIINNSIEQLSGQVRKCSDSIEKNASESQNELKKAQVARSKGNDAVMKISARQAGRLEDLNEKRLKPLLAQMQAHLAMLRKFAEATLIIRTDLQNEVRVQEQQREAILASYTAMRAAKSILAGGQDEREMFDQAMEFTAHDYSMKIGAIENFIANSQPFMDSMDIQNGVWEQDALSRMGEWDEQVNSLLNGTSVSPQLEAPKESQFNLDNISKYDNVVKVSVVKNDS